MILAHIAGVPVEETLLPFSGVAAAALLIARTWVASRVRARRAARRTSQATTEGDRHAT